MYHCSGVGAGIAAGFMDSPYMTVMHKGRETQGLRGRGGFCEEGLSCALQTPVRQPTKSQRGRQAGVDFRL